MKGRKLQIDVKGHVENNKNIMVCNLYIDSRCCRFFMSIHHYEALMQDGVFLRDGKTADSADVINTTNVYEEQL